MDINPLQLIALKYSILIFQIITEYHLYECQYIIKINLLLIIMKKLKTLNLERTLYIPSKSNIKNNLVQQHKAQIIKVLNQIDSLTNNLDKKLGTIMLRQQTQFVESYKQHMTKIRDEIQLLHQQLQNKDKIINMYQSDGMIAELLKKIYFLEEKQLKLLEQMEKKKEIIKQLNLEKQINKSQNKRLQQRVKQLIQSRARSLSRLTNQVQHMKSNQTFQTEILPDTQITAMQKFNYSIQRKHSKYSNSRSQKQSFTINPQTQHNLQLDKLHKTVNTMQKQIKSLMKQNMSIRQQFKDAGNFFLSIISQMKKSICKRKKLKYCSFEDFRKQDKIELLIKILSNDQILVCLYNKIFDGKGQSMSAVGNNNAATINFRKYSHSKNQLKSNANRIFLQ